MARPTYSDLILIYNPSAGSEGITQTASNNIIIALFKEAFRIFAKGEYDAYVVPANHPTLDTTDVYGVIIKRANVYVNAFILKSIDKTYTFNFDFSLTSEDIEAIGQAIGKSLISKDFVQRQEDNELGIDQTNEEIYY